MSEGLPLQAGSSINMQLAYQSELSSHGHLSREAGPQEEDGANQRSAHCKELLMRGGTEFSFEELRAERFYQQQQDERLRRLQELKQEVQEKKQLLLLRSQQVVPEGSETGAPGPAAAPSFQIYEESPSASARPAGNELQDDVFLRLDERGLCLRIQHPRPGAGGPGLSQTEEVIQSGLQSETVSSAPQETLSRPGPDVDGGTAKDLETAAESRKQLSPIQETSVETRSLTTLGGCSPLTEAPSPGGGAVDPCDPDMRRRLLDSCDVTSSPDFLSEPRPLPAVGEQSRVQLGGVLYLVYSILVDAGSFCVYAGKGAAEKNCQLIKVDRCSAPWDFHQFQRLKKTWSAADGPPLIRCFLFLDGCITVYSAPAGHEVTGLTPPVSSVDVIGKVAGLLTLVSQMHSCRLLHAALQPHLLACSLSPLSQLVFPLDWSSSVDLDLQQDITSVQQLPSAQNHISLGLLEPDAPPQLVDLVGVAETAHLLLTNSRMVAVKDEGGWTAEKFSRDKPCDTFSLLWRRFFHSLLNAGGRSPEHILSELKEQLSLHQHQFILHI